MPKNSCDKGERIAKLEANHDNLMKEVTEVKKKVDETNVKLDRFISEIRDMAQQFTPKKDFKELSEQVNDMQEKSKASENFAKGAVWLLRALIGAVVTMSGALIWLARHLL